MRAPDQFTQDGSMFIGIVGPIILFFACIVALVLAVF